MQNLRKKLCSAVWCKLNRRFMYEITVNHTGSLGSIE